MCVHPFDTAWAIQISVRGDTGAMLYDDNFSRYHHLDINMSFSDRLRVTDADDLLWLVGCRLETFCRK